MASTEGKRETYAKMSFSKVNPMYLQKVERKGRTKDELHEVITWLTGFNDEKIQRLVTSKASFENVFETAALNPKAHLITGVICGYRVEDIADDLIQKIRYLDKLVDELAKGKKWRRYSAARLRRHIGLVPYLFPTSGQRLAPVRAFAPIRN